MRTVLKSKLHRAYVTETGINYEDSITIDRKLMEEADILPYCHVEDNKARNFIPKLVDVDVKNAIIETKRAVESIFFKEETNAYYHKPNKGHETKV